MSHPRPRISPVPAKPTFFLPVRTTPPPHIVPSPGNHTYYLSCDKRGFSKYLPVAIKSAQNGFRAALVAPAGLVLEAPSVVLCGLQGGDTFLHASLWAQSNPLREIEAEHLARQAPVSLKDLEKAQLRLGEAISTIAGVEEARVEAEEELEAATAGLIALHGPECIVIDGVYWDASYSREHVYLKERLAKSATEEVPRETDVRVPKKSSKKSAKRSKRAA